MKVLLLNPPASGGVRIVREGRCMQRQGAWTAVWAPISLSLSAALLEKQGFKVKINDCIVENIGWVELKKVISDFGPDLVVFNAVTPSIESDLSVARICKEIDSKIKTAAFGIHGTVLPEESLNMQLSLDFIIRGEPEFTLGELAIAIRENKDISSIGGISHRHGDRNIHNPARSFEDDLDKMPFPAWHLINPENYRMPFTDEPFLLVATSRGCPYSCSFCADNAYYGKKLRLRSPARIAEELAWVKEKFDISQFLFWAESFTLDRKFVVEVCDQIIVKKLSIKWVCNSRVNNVDKEMLHKMKQAGCWMIGFGIESGSQKILNMIGKKTTLEQSRKAVKLSKDAGLEVTGHVVLGLPGDTNETIRETIDFVKGIDPDFAQFYCAVPFPGSKLYIEAKEKGWINTSQWQRFEQNYSVLDLDAIKAKEIMEWRKRAYKEFYLRPKMIFRTLSRLHSLKEYRNFLKMVFDFLTWV